MADCYSLPFCVPHWHVGRWEDNIRMDFWEIRWEGVVWMYVAGYCEHDNERSVSI